MINSSMIFYRCIQLCVHPLSSCDLSTRYDQVRNHHQVSYRIILAVVGSGLAVFTSVVLTVVLFMRREKAGKIHQKYQHCG